MRKGAKPLALARRLLPPILTTSQAAMKRVASERMTSKAQTSDRPRGHWHVGFREELEAETLSLGVNPVKAGG